MRRGGRVLAALALAVVLGTAGAALGAEEIEGQRVVLAKDVKAGTLLLDGSIVLHVSAKTRITGVDGERISLAELPTAVKDPARDVYAVRGVETIRFEARRTGDALEASVIEVVGKPLE